MEPRQRLLNFVLEREAIRVRRENYQHIQAGKGWTTDPILAAYRFCNVRREDDRVTRWIAANWRSPHSNDPDLWFAMCVARFINWPPTLERIGYPVPWKGLQFVRRMRSWQSTGKVYTGAYMVRSDREWAGRPKHEYLEEMQFSPLWRARKTLRPRSGDSLASYHLTLGAFYGLGSFMAAQVVADLKYVEPLLCAPDWMTFAASGPGSRRGLNRMLEYPTNQPWREDDWRMTLGRLQEWLNGELRWDEPLHAQDVQNVLCEFDKYERVRLGEGRPRARFQPS